MKISVSRVTDWLRALNAARRTVGKSQRDEQPSENWRDKMLLAEHSPIRLIEFDVIIDGIKQWITAHLCRHWLGFIPFVHSQRPDRRQLDCNRDELPQGSLNDMQFSANAQALINISRKRLCYQAAPETRQFWENVKTEITKIDKSMGRAMVRECVYRGFCPEMRCCGYAWSKEYQKELYEYRSVSDWAERYVKI